MNANLVIDETNVRPAGEVFNWAAEASDLGLRAGEVPQFLPTTLGNGQPFVLVSADCARFNYRQDCGCVTLAIYND